MNANKKVTRKEIQKAIDKANKSLSQAEGSIRFYTRQAERFTELLEQLNASLEALPPEVKRAARKPLELPIRLENGASLVELEEFPKEFRGTDYGSEGKVIARRGTKIIWWAKGHTAWSGRGQTSYYGGALHGIDKSVTNIKDPNFVGNYDTGNSLKDSLKNNDEKIREWLDIDFSLADCYKPKTTILIEE